MKLAIIATLLLLVTISLAILYTYRRSEKRYSVLHEIIAGLTDRISFLTLRTDALETALVAAVNRVKENESTLSRIGTNLGFERKVLCITRTELDRHTQWSNGVLRNIELDKIPKEHYHLLDRSIADSKEDTSIGYQLVQAIGYVVICCEGQYLTYSRKKGEEQRLHGTRSLGFGGHIDITDVWQTATNSLDTEIPFNDVLINGVVRELREELGLPEETLKRLQAQFKLTLGHHCIMDTRDQVGLVHLGLVFVANISKDTFYEIGVEEDTSPLWMDEALLIDQLHLFEKWSQTVIEDIIT